MDRREAIRLLATAATLQLAQRNSFAALREARALLGKPTALRTLDLHQNATVTAIAELIIPRTETPGATDVGVSKFIDVMLTEWYVEKERNCFLNGLAEVDVRTQELLGKDFVDCSPRQQAQILTALGEQMAEEAVAVRDHTRSYRGSLPEPDKTFYYMLRSLTLTGYYTSEDGATTELDFHVIPDRHDDCADTRTSKGDRRTSEG